MCVWDQYVFIVVCTSSIIHRSQHKGKVCSIDIDKRSDGYVGCCRSLTHGVVSEQTAVFKLVCVIGKVFLSMIPRNDGIKVT